MLPLPELDRQEKPLVANLLLQGGEQKAMRVASTMPDIYYPSSNPGKVTYDDRARTRKMVNLAWWDVDRMRLKLRKRARHMVYYASSPVMLRPNFKEARPTWQVRNPLTTFAPEMDAGDLVPDDIIFTYVKSYAWLQSRYPEQANRVAGDTIQDGVFQILEYQDADELVLVAYGTKIERPTQYVESEVRAEVIIELERQPNRVGRCTAVVPGRIGLEHARGEFDGVVGLWQAQARIMALSQIGMQREIFPEEWLVDDPTGDGATIVTHADPLHGIVGHVTGGKLQTVQPNLSQMSGTHMDRLERAFRIEAGIPAELQGESGTNIRTGRRGDSVLSAVMDFPIQEHQEILAVALQEENKAAVAIDKAYFPRKKSIWISATAGEIDYEANTLWENDTHFVKYAHAGVDAQGLVIETAQRVGAGLMSKRSAMETDPLIDDPEAEFDRMEIEHIRDGLLQGLAAMAQDPTMAPIVASVTMKLRSSEVEIEDAVTQVHEAMQQMQAAQAQQAQAAGPPGAGPGGPGPEAQPGMAQPIPSIPQAPAGITNLTGLLTQLKRGGNAAVPNEMNLAS